MNLATVKIEKKIKTLTGAEITRKATVNYPVPENEQEVASLLGANAWKWAIHGMKLHLRTNASNSLSGGDAKNKQLRRQFTQAYESFTKIMGMSGDDATKMLLGKDMFAPLVAEIEELKAADAVKNIVYGEGNIPEPKWFAGDADEDEESEETATNA